MSVSLILTRRGITAPLSVASNQSSIHCSPRYPDRRTKEPPTLWVAVPLTNRWHFFCFSNSERRILPPCPIHARGLLLTRTRRPYLLPSSAPRCCENTPAWRPPTRQHSPGSPICVPLILYASRRRFFLFPTVDQSLTPLTFAGTFSRPFHSPFFFFWAHFRNRR